MSGIDGRQLLENGKQIVVSQGGPILMARAVYDGGGVENIVASNVDIPRSVYNGFVGSLRNPGWRNRARNRWNCARNGGV